MRVPAKLAGALLVLGVAILSLARYPLHHRSSEPPASFAGFPAFPIDNSRFTGTASCSGRACHGSLEPSSERASIQGNEHTTWLTRDHHADAYRVLLDERSARIARALDPTTPAHESARCLACHVNPSLLEDKSEFARAEKQAGVGCETCHGPARDWLEPHTGWGHFNREQKRELYVKHSMRWLAGPRERAEICVGCHVGAEQGDVDHDLIAAGHPRLEFELTAFLANMPPHWRERNAESRQEAQAWAVGQVVTARAGLSLLKRRAERKAWPEFAEYDCFACHHDLSDRRWRREPGRFGTRPLGSLSWNQRDLTFFPELLQEKVGDADRARIDIAREMAKPRPDNTRVRQQAESLDAMLGAALTRLEKKPARREDARAWMTAIASDPNRFTASWDAAAQAFLALDALRRACGNTKPDSTLRELGEMLAFPPATDSPSGFRMAPDFEGRFDALLRRIQTGFGPVPDKPVAPNHKP